MRIGITYFSSNKYISGVEYYSLGMIDALLRFGGEHEYVAFTNQPGQIEERVCTSKNLRIMDLSHIRTRLQRIAWEHLTLPRLTKREELDILHCPHYICPVLRTNARYVVTVHDTIALDHPEWCTSSNSLYYRRFMKHSIRAASLIIAVSHNTAADITRNFPLALTKIQVIYPGIDPIFDVHRNSSRQPEIRDRYALPKKYILYVGNIEPKKNICSLLNAHRILRKTGLPHKLVLVGERHWKSQSVLNRLSQYSDELGIVRTGYLDRRDLPCVYQMADVFVFPSLYEGFGFPPLEAMACGTPVISSTMGALREVVGDAAYPVDPTNPEEIAHALLLMITRTDLRAKHMQKGWTRSQLYSWAAAARGLLSAYKDVVENNGRSH